MAGWNDKYAVGIRTVDEQHKGLIEKIDELRNAMRAGEGRTKLASLIQFLGGYAVKHFTTEEGLMRLYGYPKFDEHKKIHEDFKADFGKLAAEVDSTVKSSLLTIEVERRLSNWLIAHIQARDKEAAAFMTAKGAR